MTHHFAQRRPREAQETVPWIIGKTATVWNFLGADPTVITAKEVEPGDFGLSNEQTLWVWTGLVWLQMTEPRTVTTKQAAYTTVGTDDVIFCDASDGAFTVTLRAAASSDGKLLYIKKIDDSAFEVTIDGAGTETIDDGETAVLTVQYESLTLVCDGTEWFIV